MRARSPEREAPRKWLFGTDRSKSGAWHRFRGARHQTLRQALDEAEREDGRAAEPAQLLDRRGDVGLDELRLRRVHMRPVLEVVAALRHAGRAAEIVDRNRGEPPLRKAQGELLVEAIEPANIGQD